MAHREDAENAERIEKCREEEQLEIEHRGAVSPQMAREGDTGESARAAREAAAPAQHIPGERRRERADQRVDAERLGQREYVDDRSRQDRLDVLPHGRADFRPITRHLSPGRA